MPDSWPSCFLQAEVELYTRLIDYPSDAWHIRDLLVELRLEEVAPVESGIGLTLELATSSINYIARELAVNTMIIPSSLIRPGAYPHIRQMRDVHQFDVGSHLAYCHALAVRLAPLTLLSDLRLSLLHSHVETAVQSAPQAFLSLSSVFHDFYKCFRRRRPLPGKVGESVTPIWKLPNNTTPKRLLEVSKSEEEIAELVLPHFLADPATRETVLEAVAFSGRMGKLLYQAILLDTSDQCERVFASYWRAAMKERRCWLGLFLGIVDWLGKGYIQYVVTARKGGRRSLAEAGMCFLAVGETIAAERAREV